MTGLVIIPDAAERAMQKMIDELVGRDPAAETERAEIRQMLVNHLAEYGNFHGVELVKREASN